MTGCNRFFTLFSCRQRLVEMPAMTAAVPAVVLASMIAFAGPLAAQDTQNRDDEHPPSWYFSGLSLGAGGGSFNPSLGAKRDGRPTRIPAKNGEGWIFLNYNYRLNDRWLVGIDAEATFSSDLDPAGLIPQESFLSGLFDGTASVGLRMQYAYNRHVAGYLRAGWTQISVEDTTFNGGRLAAGLEVRLFMGLALRAEVMHDEYGSKRVTPSLRLRPSATSFRGGVLYRF